MKNYLVIVEQTRTGYSACSPDLPGCVATGRTRKEAEKEMQAAIEFHVDGPRTERCEVLKPQGLKCGSCLSGDLR